MENFELYKHLINLSYDKLKLTYPIDEIYINRQLNINSKNVLEFISNPQLMNVDGTICNWRNCYIFTRYNYVYMTVYKEALVNASKENYASYDYWYKKYIEETIKGIQSLYDKSMHIINAIYDLNCKSGTKFNENVIGKLQEIDANDYETLKNIANKRQNIMSNVRNNIEHNCSDLFPNVVCEASLYMYKSYANIEPACATEKIANLINVLQELKNFIDKAITKKFPYKFKRK